MRFFRTPFSSSILSRFLFVAALSFYPALMRADEISFAETYAEKLTPDTDVIWSGSSTLEVSLPWNGVNIDDFTGDTAIDISIGDFQFSQVLDAAEELYDPEVHSATFRDRDYDNNGNEVDVLFLDVTWNTKTFTISGVFRNYSDSGEENYFGVPSHRDVPGSFRETNQFYVSFGDLNTNYPVVVSGRTSLTHKVVDEVDYYLNDIDLSGSADLPPNDTTKPSVSITSPSANGRLLTPLITGNASDNRAVAEVFYRIGEDEFALADGTNNWSVDLSTNVSLLPGTNVVAVKSIDLAGNESPVLTRTFFYVVTSPLTVEINDAWGSTTLTNGQLLELTRNYSITANPAPGYLFFDWTGNINSTNRTVSFAMSPDFLLQPNFIPNPFIPIQGTYQGLFSDANGVTPESAGYFAAQVKDTGAFSGRIFLAGRRHSFSGRFDLDGRADKIISRRGKPALNLHLELGFNGALSGTVVQDGISSDLEAELAQSTTNSAKAKYTLLIPPAADPATAPGGYGFGFMSVDLKGRLRFHGLLGNGAHVSQGTMVSQTGRWPLFLSHSRGQGVLQGWMSFADETDSDVRGDNVTWAKLPRPRDRFYPNGFTNAGTIIGSLYVPPGRGTNVFYTNDTISGSLEFSGGNLSEPLTNTFLWDATNKLAITSTNKTTLHVVTSSGLLRGRFVHPDREKTVSIKGALLQKPRWGGGFFRGTNQTGAVLLQPNP